VVDPGERQRRIRATAAEQLAELAEPAGLVEDDELLGELVYLCEFPTVFVGRYDDEFFELPREVIVTALKAHQRYFAVSQREGERLLPYFVAVRDGGGDHLADVVAGNERVLRARLADALFYWRFDQRQTPDQRVAALESVTWLEGFGSVADKTRRLVAMVPDFWRRGLGDGEPVPEAAIRAAHLLKSDLVSEMIKDGKEFTKLEGVIGARYAERAGEAPEVCRAIERSRYPRSAGDELPSDPISNLLSVVDRFDTLAGCWLAGFAPTGAKDPYGLRRHALAILRIVIAGRKRIDTAALIERALAGFARAAEDRDLEAARDELAAFFQRRLAGLLADQLRYDPDVVRAVLPAHGNDPTDTVAWAQALSSYRDDDKFLLLATGFKRCTNILEGDLLVKAQRDEALRRWAAGGAGAAGESFADLTEPAEIALLQQVKESIPALRDAEQAGRYDEVFAILSGFGPAIDAFFDSVRVNVSDPRLRQLRHAFLREIHALFVRYAEFTALAPADD
jgi:glycyl-tRNA synthetase beta chain